ncbi:MAG TPA: ATP-binding protein [Trebonia sp.]|nr:ATP-binding protein [Trebonia sp.]
MTDGEGSETEAVVFDDRFDAATLHSLRERVAACAAAAGMPRGRAVDVILAVHELAANAVSHGAGAGRLLIRAASGALHCQVTDAGPGAGPWPVRAGHGLWIVRAVADQVTTSFGPNGSQVTAVFGWRPAASGPDRLGTQPT